jgi:hypothetical protein
MNEQLNSRCKCGHDVSATNLFLRGVYTPPDRFLLFLGATRRPILVQLCCSDCGDVFAVSSDRSLREIACARDWVRREDAEVFLQPAAL